jgi:ATP-dependent Clp protease ATP-binding subunit ClpC
VSGQSRHARSKRVVELAVDESRRMGHHYVGTEHLLIGLIREGDDIAAGVLEQQGVNLGDARTAVLRLLGDHGG